METVIMVATQSWVSLLENIPLINNVLLLLFFVWFAYIFYKADRDTASPVHWIDLIVDPKTNRVSVSRLGQFWGIAISSWMVVTLAQKIQPSQMETIFPWAFGVWLAFLGGTYVWRQNQSGQPEGLPEPSKPQDNTEEK